MDLINNQKSINKEHELTNVNSLPNFERRIREIEDIANANPTLYYKFEPLDEDDIDFYETRGIKLILSFSRNSMQETTRVGRGTKYAIRNHAAYIAISNFISVSLHAGEYVIETEMSSIMHLDIVRILLSYGAVHSNNLETMDVPQVYYNLSDISLDPEYGEQYQGILLTLSFADDCLVEFGTSNSSLYTLSNHPVNAIISSDSAVEELEECCYVISDVTIDNDEWIDQFENSLRQLRCLKSENL